METMKTTSLVDMAMGAIKERVDYEASRVIENICDPNTRAAKKRSIIVQIDILPDDDRERLQVSATVKSKLEATSPIITSLYLKRTEMESLQRSRWCHKSPVRPAWTEWNNLNPQPCAL